MADLSSTFSQYPLKLLAPAFWPVYRQHKDDTWPVKVWFISYRLKLSDLYPLWVWLYGPEITGPIAATAYPPFTAA